MRPLQPPASESPGYHETPSLILPAVVPPALSAAVDAASRRAEALAASGRGLHFEVDGQGGLAVQLRGPGGEVVKTLSPTQAISLMGGLGPV